MKYEEAPDIQERVIDIVKTLGMNHIYLDRVGCLRSFGSSTKRTIARCHALGKVMQKAMKTKAFYTIEFLEKFDKMPKHEQDKVIIHELLHVPKTFGGGFRQHDFVCEDNINKLHRKFLDIKKSLSFGSRLLDAQELSVLDIKGERYEKNKSWFW